MYMNKVYYFFFEFIYIGFLYLFYFQYYRIPLLQNTGSISVQSKDVAEIFYKFYKMCSYQKEFLEGILTQWKRYPIQPLGLGNIYCSWVIFN